MIKIETARLARCNPDGTRSDEGLYVLADELKITASKGAASITLCVMAYTDENGDVVEVQVPKDLVVAEGGYKEAGPGLLAGKEFLLGFDYLITFKVTDSDGTAQTTITVPRAFVNFHQSGATTGGAAFGMYSRATDGDPRLDSAYPFYGHGGIYGADGNRLDGMIEEEIKSLASGFALYTEGEYPVAMRIGKLVILDGKLTPTASISGGSDEHNMFSLPREYWPTRDIYQLCQGSNYNKWLLHIDTYGAVSMARYSTGSAVSVAAGAWLPFHAVWAASDYTGPVRVQRPAAAMTSKSSQGCVARASGDYGPDEGSYAPWKAFDYKETTSWASEENASTMWIELEMDVALADIEVEVYARQTKNLSSPVAGRVLCSNDRSSWKELATFSDWNGKQNGGLMGKLACGNETAYKYVRLDVTKRIAGSSYVAIGYLRITGYIP